MRKVALCPKHKQPLNLKNETIQLADHSIDLCTGTCPHCDTTYVNHPIMSFSIITIAGRSFKYLPGMPDKAEIPQESEKDRLIKQLTEQNASLQFKLAEANKTIEKLNKRDSKYYQEIENSLRNKMQSKIQNVKKEYEKEIKKQKEQLLNQQNAKRKDFLETQRIFTAKIDSANSHIKMLQSEVAKLSKENESLARQLSQTSEPTPKVVFVNEKLYVCGGVIRCEKHNHERKDVTGIIDTIAGTPITMTVCYCKNCKLYYVKDAVFESYRSRYGTLLGQFVRQEDGMMLGRPSNYGELAPESVLHMNGYNVSQARDLSAAVRRKILAYIIESRIMDKNDIRKHLSYLIKMNRSNPHKEAAVEKWTSDVNWVNDYRSGGQDFVWLSGTAMYRNRQRKA